MYTLVGNSNLYQSVERASCERVIIGGGYYNKQIPVPSRYLALPNKY